MVLSMICNQIKLFRTRNMNFGKQAGTKIENRKFIGTKNQSKFLEGLKLKVGIFIGTINIFNPLKFVHNIESIPAGQKNGGGGEF